MSIVPASSLSRADLRSLGANCMATVAHDRHSIRAVNHSLAIHDESVERLYRRAGNSRADRLRSRA